MLTQTITNGLIDAVRQAAKSEILPRFRNLAPEDIDTKSSPDDLVTIADKQAEIAITKAVRAILPDAMIIGEEAVAEEPDLLEKMSDSPLTVIIDPIDGTSNFAAGVAVFGVILAVMVDGEAIFGLLYDPVMDDWILAHKGQGAYFETALGHRQKLAGTTPKPVAESCGHIPLYLFPKDTQPRLAAAYPKFKRITTLRCSCHEYRQMALGHVDLTLNEMAKPWDHAAGALVIRECGGMVVSQDDAPYDPSNPKTPLWGFAHSDAAVQAAIKSALLG